VVDNSISAFWITTAIKPQSPTLAHRFKFVTEGFIFNSKLTSMTISESSRGGRKNRKEKKKTHPVEHTCCSEGPNTVGIDLSSFFFFFSALAPHLFINLSFLFLLLLAVATGLHFTSWICPKKPSSF
jgi:hypothetical protein